MRLFLFVLFLGCGSRTGLPIDERARDSGLDAAACGRDRDCADDFDCTANRCVRGVCEVRPRNDRCEDTTCTTGQCDPALGCVSVPIPCDDGVECTVDECSEDLGCTSTPDDLLCPISNRCDPERGCIARALIHDSLDLYEVELPSGELRLLTPTGPRFTDIALAPDRQLYGVSRGDLYTLVDDSPAVRRLGASDSWVALDFGPDGRLYAAGENDRIVAIDTTTFEPTVVARLPAGFVASGDIAFVEGRMLVTITDEPSSTFDDTRLAEVDLESGDARILGRTGEPCVWALAAFGPELFGFNCNGRLLRIDPFSGSSDVLRVFPGLRVGGAAAR
ncbi:MAG: hypothetical protein AAGE52_10545 [Myxococcota bacterium]